MSLPTLVQVTCSEGSTSRLVLWRGDQRGELYFDGGEIAHAVSGNYTGEEAVYELLTWEEGDFELETDVKSPEQTITTSWSALLLEGMRRLDEATDNLELEQLEQSKPKQKEAGKMAKRRSEMLADVLSELIDSSGDIEGGALVGIDGLVLSSNVPVRGLDETLVGAAAAAIFGLSRRSVEQMARGDFFQTLIQGSNGNIIVTYVDDRNVFVGITPADVNLGMAFHEARQVSEKLGEVLS